MAQRDVIVRWSQWFETWRHISAGSYGSYSDREAKFATEAEADAFIAGARLNYHCKDFRKTY